MRDLAEVSECGDEEAFESFAEFEDGFRGAVIGGLDVEREPIIDLEDVAAVRSSSESAAEEGSHKWCGLCSIFQKDGITVVRAAHSII